MNYELHSGFLYPLRKQGCYFFFLLLIEVGKSLLVFLLGGSIAQFTICTHYLVLQSEIGVIVSITIYLQLYDMRLSRCYNEMPQLFAQSIIYLGRLVLYGEFSTCHQMQCHYLLTIHIKQLLLFLRVYRRQLSSQPLRAVHRGGHKEEDEQHERDVGCRCRVESWYTMSFSASEHFSSLIYHKQLLPQRQQASQRR